MLYMNFTRLIFLKRYMIWAIIALFFLFFSAVGCVEKDKGNLEQPEIVKEPVVFEHAKNVKMDSFSGGFLLEIMAKQWLLIDKNSKNFKKPKEWDSIPVIYVPVERPVILSTSYLGYLRYLGVDSKIVGVGEKKYIADSAFYQFIEAKNIPNLGNGALLSLEKLFSLQPDLVLTFSSGEAKHEDYLRMKSLNLPVILASEWNEVSPLAKAEWLKVFGVLFDRYSLSDSLFRDIEQRYQKKASFVEKMPDSLRPTVLIGGPVGGIWYAPSPLSYTAELVRDAGGRYIWADQNTNKWFNFSLEEALLQGKNADIWIHPSNFKTPEEVLQNERRVDLLKAWKEKRVFQNDKRVGPVGGNDFYEEAVVRPDLVLEDLIKVFYPNFFEDSSMRWYRNIYIF
jgi:iron complex transport system substrate-binding protein